MKRLDFIKALGVAIVAPKMVLADAKTLEYLIEEVFVDFAKKGYDANLNPTAENLAKYEAAKQKLRQEERKAFSEGELKNSLVESPNTPVSDELEAKGYLFEKTKLNKPSDSYLVGKLVGKPQFEDRFKILRYKNLVPLFDEYKRSLESSAHRKGNEIYLNVNAIKNKAEKIISGDSENALEKKYFADIANQFNSRIEAVSQEIEDTYKVHEKGHCTRTGDVTDEVRAMLSEIMDSESRFGVYRVWHLTQDEKIDWVHRKAARKVLGLMSKYRTPEGKRYIAEFTGEENTYMTAEILSEAGLGSIRKTAEGIFGELYQPK